MQVHGTGPSSTSQITISRDEPRKLGFHKLSRCFLRTLQFENYCSNNAEYWQPASSRDSSSRFLILADLPLLPRSPSSSLNCPAPETLLLTSLAPFPDHSWLLPLLAVLSWWQWGNCHIVTPAPPWYTDRQISTQAVQCPQEQAGLCPFESQVSDPSCPEKASFCQPKVPGAEGNSQQLRLTFKALLGIDKSTEEGFTDLAG